MMEKMMAGVVKPEDMPRMIDTMMDKMFSALSAEDGIQFVTTMMPKRLDMIFDEIGPEARVRLAEEMIAKMMSIFKEQIEKKLLD